jgi:hypothetical protein
VHTILNHISNLALVVEDGHPPRLGLQHCLVRFPRFTELPFDVVDIVGALNGSTADA